MSSHLEVSQTVTERSQGRNCSRPLKQETRMLLGGLLVCFLSPTLYTSYTGYAKARRRQTKALRSALSNASQRGPPLGREETVC